MSQMRKLIEQRLGLRPTHYGGGLA